jgi:hypothetical protein
MSLNVPAIGIVLAILAFVVKPIADAVLKRLGERVADWCLPDDRPTSYRVARGLCHLAGLVAPRRSAARGASRGALSDVDELKRDQAGASSALGIALSLMSPAAAARVRWTLHTTGTAIGGSLVGIATMFLTVWPVLPVVGFLYGYMSAAYALTGQLDSSARYEGPFTRMVSVVSCCVYIVMAPAGLGLLFADHLVLGPVIAASGVSGCVGMYFAACTDWVRRAARLQLFRWDQRLELPL